MKQGCDVSAWELPLYEDDPLIEFVHVKLTQGISYVNFSAFKYIPKTTREVAVGGYHYLTPGAANQQAENFVKQLSLFVNDVSHSDSKAIFNMIPMVDVEDKDQWTNPAQVQMILDVFLHALINHGIAQKPLIYTNWDFWANYMRGYDGFSGHPLMLAEYNGNNAPDMSGMGWTDWTIWQHTDNQQTPMYRGPGGGIDFSYLNPAVDLNDLRLKV